MRRPALSLLLITTLLVGCRCAEPASTPDEAGPEGFEWAASWAPEDVPSGEMAASLGGRSVGGLHVLVREEGDSSRIEITDSKPDGGCDPAPGAQGFSIKLPGRLDEGDRLVKAMDDHPKGWSAFIVTRGDDGAAISTVARAWSFSLVVTGLDADGGMVEGRLALGFDDEQRSGAAGRFHGRYCPGSDQ